MTPAAEGAGPADRRGAVMASVALLLAVPAVLWSALYGLALQGVGPAIGAVSALSDAAGVEAVFESAVPIVPEQLPALAASAQRGLASAPLAVESFFFRGAQFAARRRFDEALPLFEEARRRTADHAPTRFWLMGEYARRERVAPAVAEAAITLRLNPEVGPQIMPALVQLLRLPNARRPLARALRDNASWRQDFLVTAAAQKIDPELTTGVIEQMRAAGGELTPSEQSVLLNDLMENGRYRRALALWRATQGRGVQDRGPLLDQNFSGRPGIHPFSWTFATSDQGNAVANPATPTETSNLRVSYFGGAAVTLASQSIVAPPGKYTLSFSGLAEQTGGDPTLVWELSCLADQRKLASLAVTPLADQLMTRTVPVAIPSQGCGAQKLALVGLPGQQGGDFEGVFRRVALTRVRP